MTYEKALAALEEFNSQHPIVAMGSREWERYNILLTAIAEAENARKYRRYLCYRHACQEFDKLPSIQRWKASYWHTVPADECELCQEEAH